MGSVLAFFAPPTPKPSEPKTSEPDLSLSSPKLLEGADDAELPNTLGTQDPRELGAPTLDEFELNEVDVLSSEWGGQIPHRHSPLFPRAPARASNDAKDHATPKRGSELLERDTPSAQDLFNESERLMTPQPPAQRVTSYPRATPKIETAPHTVGDLSTRDSQAPHEQDPSVVGRLMKREPPPQDYPDYKDIHRDAKSSEADLLMEPHRPHQVMSEYGTYALNPADDESHLTSAAHLGEPGSEASSESDYASIAYHDVLGERSGGVMRIGRRRGASQDTPRDFNVVTPRSSLSDLSLDPGLSAAASSPVRVDRPTPRLTPKPIRFKEGNYLRFWGNYSAQPSYLHFGSLVRSERFIDLLPIWYHDLDDLEQEAQKEWEYLEGEIPSEGEADWRRLLNPTLSSPIDFLLHRDRLEQIQMLPHKRMF